MNPLDLVGSQIASFATAQPIIDTIMDRCEHFIQEKVLNKLVKPHAASIYLQTAKYVTSSYFNKPDFKGLVIDN